MANPTADFPTALHTQTDVSAYANAKLGATSTTHTEVEGKQETEIIAVQTKIGTGVSTPTSGKILTGTGVGTSAWQDPTDLDVSAVWGGVTGTLSNQTDLQSALDGKSATSHNHTGTYEPANANIQSHIGTTTGNPHSVDETDILPSQTTHSGKYLTTNGTASSWDALATVANSGSYNDLSDQPTIPSNVKLLQFKVVADDTEITTGDGKLHFFITPELNGMNLTDADAGVSTVSSSGLPTVQIHNVTDAQDMLSTAITIDASAKTSYTATTAPVINGTYDDVATGDEIRIDVDVAGTGAKGLTVMLKFS